MSAMRFPKDDADGFVSKGRGMGALSMRDLPLFVAVNGTGGTNRSGALPSMVQVKARNNRADDDLSSLAENNVMVEHCAAAQTGRNLLHAPMQICNRAVGMPSRVM